MKEYFNDSLNQTEMIEQEYNILLKYFTELLNINDLNRKHSQEIHIDMIKEDIEELCECVKEFLNPLKQKSDALAVLAIIDLRQKELDLNAEEVACKSFKRIKNK